MLVNLPISSQSSSHTLQSLNETESMSFPASFSLQITPDTVELEESGHVGTTVPSPADFLERYRVSEVYVRSPLFSLPKGSHVSQRFCDVENS